MKTSNELKTSTAALEAGAQDALDAVLDQAMVSGLVVHPPKQVGGSSDNPQVETVFLYKGGAREIWLEMGRGRKGKLTVTTEGDSFGVVLRMENHHRSRGWTIALEVRLYDEDGNLLNTAFFKQGLKPKLWTSYKRETKAFDYHGIADDVVYIQFTMYRDASKRFLGELAENALKYGPKVIRAVNGDPKALAALAIEIHGAS